MHVKPVPYVIEELRVFDYVDHGREIDRIVTDTVVPNPRGGVLKGVRTIMRAICKAASQEDVDLRGRHARL